MARIRAALVAIAVLAGIASGRRRRPDGDRTRCRRRRPAPGDGRRRDRGRHLPPGDHLHRRLDHRASRRSTSPARSRSCTRSPVRAARCAGCSGSAVTPDRTASAAPTATTGTGRTSARRPARAASPTRVPVPDPTQVHDGDVEGWRFGTGAEPGYAALPPVTTPTTAAPVVAPPSGPAASGGSVSAPVAGPSGAAASPPMQLDPAGAGRVPRRHHDHHVARRPRTMPATAACHDQVEGKRADRSVHGSVMERSRRRRRRGRIPRDLRRRRGRARGRWPAPSPVAATTGTVGGCHRDVVRRPRPTSARAVARATTPRAFYERFTAPTISDDADVAGYADVDRIIVGDARAMTEIPDACVALVVTSPPYFAGKAYEEEMGQGHIPADYVEYLEMLARRLRRVRARARAGRPHRGQRRQPRPQAVPVARGRRHRDPPGRPRPAAARRGRVGEGQGRDAAPPRGARSRARPTRCCATSASAS